MKNYKLENSHSKRCSNHKVERQNSNTKY